MKIINKENTGISPTEKITRMDAIKKAGITALTAASLVFLSTQKSAASSQPKQLKPTRPGRT